MKWNGGPFTFGILVDDVAAALACDGKTPVFPRRNRFRAQSGVEAWASDSNFNSRQAHRNLRDFFSIGQAIFDVQLNRVLDVLNRFFVSVALAVTTLERGARNEKPVRVSFDDDGKSNVLHNSNHYRSALKGGKTE